MNDNPYSFILTDQPQSMMSIPDAKEVGMELNSLEQIISTWLAARWNAVGKKENINSVLKVKSNMDSGVLWDSEGSRGCTSDT